MKLHIPIVLFLFSMFFCSSIQGQVQISPKYSVNGAVNAMLFKGDTLIVGGNFTSVGMYTGGAALFTNGADKPDLSFPKINGEISLCTPDGNGGFYVYGNYSRESEPLNSASKRIEHILANNSFENNFSLSVNAGGLNKMLFHNGVLYVGGYQVNTIDGQTAGDLCAINTNTKQILSWIPAIANSNGIKALAAYQNTLYFSGDFTAVGGNARNASAAIEIGTGTVKPWQPDITGGFNDAVLYKDKIILGGGFHDGSFNDHACAIADTITGNSVQYLFNSSSLYWAAGISCMTLLGDTLFTYSDGTYDTRVTALDLANGNTTLWVKYFNMTGLGNAMAAVNGSLYIAGTFDETFITNQDNSQNNFERKVTGLISLNTATGNVNNWTANVLGGYGNDANCISVSGNRLFAGGDFSHVCGALRRNICMLDVKNDLILSFNIDFDWTDIRTLKLNDTVLYAGGSIGQIGGQWYNRPVLAFSVGSGALLPWQPDLTGTAEAVEIIQDNIVIGGDMNEAPGGLGRKNLFAANKTNAVLSNWTPNPDYSVKTLHNSQGKLYVGGDFTNISGENRSHLVCYDDATFALTTWNPGVDGPVYTITSTDSTIWIGGQYFKVGNIDATLFSGLSAQTGLLVDTPTSHFAWPVRSVVAKGRYVIAGGGFNLGGSNPCNNIYMYDRVNRKILDPGNFCINFENGGVRSLLFKGDDLYFGGDFVKINGKTQASNIGLIRFPAGFFDGSTSKDTITYYPKSGGNGGNVTINFFGYDIQPNMKVRLSMQGVPDIIAIDSLTLFPRNYEMEAVFNLQGVSTGDYDVIITDGSGKEYEYIKGFKIEDFIPCNPWVQIIGGRVIRTGIPSEFVIQVGNNGNCDAKSISLLLMLQGNDSLFFVSQIGDFYANFVDSVAYATLDSTNGYPDNTKGYWLAIPKIAPNSAANIIIKILPFESGNFNLKAITGHILPPGERKVSGGSCLGTLMDYSLGLLTEVSGLDQGEKCLASSVSTGYAIANALVSKDFSSIDALDFGGNLAATFITCVQLHPAFKAAKVAKKLANTLDNFFTGFNTANGMNSIISDCGDMFNDEDSHNGESQTSSDPNTKIGTGINVEHYITGEQPLPYGILFENADNATLPAQVVKIIDTLDETKVDLTSFRLNFFSIGDHIVNFNLAKDMTAEFLDLRPQQNIIVKVVPKLTGNIFTADFTSLDPGTMQPVTDPLLGFLPPNKNNPEGQGSIYFSVKAKESLSNKTVISNKSSIYFDANAPIETSAWINTLDKAAPTSKMNSLPATVRDTTFTISWTGKDGESGIGKYDIYYSVNGSSFIPYAENVRTTSIQFTGKPDSTYSFYSVAIDSVNNREIKDTMETKTTILQEEVIVYPNPANDKIYIRVKKGITVTGLSLTNMQGEEIGMNYQLSDNYYIIPVSHLHSGVYVLKIQTQDRIITHKVAIGH